MTSIDPGAHHIPNSLWLTELDESRYPAICAAIRELDLCVISTGGFWLGWTSNAGTEAIIASPTMASLVKLEQFCANHANDYVKAGAALEQSGAYPAPGAWFWQRPL